MIQSRKELKFFIMADMMMNRDKFKWSIVDRIKHIILPDYIMRYLKSLRYCQYFADSKAITPLLYPLILFHQIRFRKLGIKLGFSIGCQSLGYGVVIPHYGTIVIGGSNRLGNYVVLHTSTCISNNGKIIGNALYLSTGAKITSKVTIGDNVSVGANSVVNKSFDSNMMIAGAPAKHIKIADAWYIRDGEAYTSKVDNIEKLKERFINENRL
jgi:serine O-acetyltransferase